jgi:hypothetical protein
MKRKLAAVGLLTVVLVGSAAPALANPPGPGSKQCTPGQNPQPQPGQKGGTCPGNHH